MNVLCASLHLGRQSALIAALATLTVAGLAHDVSSQPANHSTVNIKLNIQKQPLIRRPTRHVGVEKTLSFLNNKVSPKYRLKVEENVFAENNIRRGYQLLGQIWSGTYSRQDDGSSDGQDVVAVMWALFNAAVEKGDGYEQGSFVVEDRNRHLFEFLSKNKECGARHSSHLHAASALTGAEHYGIDILGSYQSGAASWSPYSVTNPDYSQQNILPARKGTILFIEMPGDSRIGLDTNQVFIKMEDHGLKTWYGYGNHAYDFVSGTLLKLGASPSYLTRKERIDPEIVKAYKNVIAHFPSELKTKNIHITVNKQAASMGVRVMFSEVNRLRLLDSKNLEFKQSMYLFFKAIARKNYDNINMRTGDEVIFAEKEWQAPLEDLDLEQGGTTSMPGNHEINSAVQAARSLSEPGIEPSLSEDSDDGSDKERPGCWDRVKSWIW